MSKRVYWDSCAFLGLINGEPGKLTDCRAVWKEAQRGRVTIYTSFFTFTEVFKAKCEDGFTKPLSEEKDREMERFFRQKWIRPILLDERIAVSARRLMRTHPECKKPSDAVHLATAIALSVEEMNTYDGADLLKLSGKIDRADGKPLRICPPKPQPAEPSPEEMFPKDA